MKIVLKNSNVKKVTAVWTWKCNFATQQAWMSRLQRRKCRQNFQLEWKLIKLLSLLTCLQEGSDRNFFSSVKNSCFTLLTVKRLKRALHRSNRLSLTASLRTCARIIADNLRSIFAMRRTDMSLIPSVLAIWRDFLLVPGWSSSEQIMSPTAAVFCAVRADFGRLGNVATDRLQSVQTPLLCRIPWSDGFSTEFLFVQSLNTHLVFVRYPTHR